MKNFLIACLAAVLPAMPAEATTFEIGVQYTLNSGFSIQWSPGLGGGCGAANQGGNNCAAIPAGKTLIECTGTQTIKVPNIELLARVVAGTANNFQIIWTGHHLSSVPTIQVRTPVLPPDNTFMGGNSVWVEFQANNYGGTSPPGGGWEMQITCSAQ